ncbi:hypothetical protein BDV95DRAFT_598508 [Massariosphaeria phaeospora]|uniref:Uncharacterized protein n=1 Tax=Massariosphaeria phaeospora TaxID=100035 RepID=A0A7C8I393_9PLEO|nr:hypothetical protein BDV95DRAFT_598508 [Massariosphaeria phaeospora]
MYIIFEHFKKYRNPPTTQWTTGFWRRFPWTGILALVSTVAAIILMVYILTQSDGQPINTQRFQPTVILAVSSTLANVALHYALSEALTVAWWVKAVKPGARVKDLHNIWAFGNNLKDVLRSWRSFNLIAMAGVLVALAPMNGPLLQRASVISQRSIVEIKFLTFRGMHFFETGFLYHEHERGMGNFTALFVETPECEGVIVRRRCTLRPGIIEYPFLLVNDTISLDPAGSWTTDRTVALSDARIQQAQGPTIHGGVWFYLDTLFNSSVHQSNAGAVGWNTVVKGTTSFRYLLSGGGLTAYGLSFSDPTHDILSTLREIAFRVALAVQPNHTFSEQHIQVQETRSETVYES